MNPMSSYNRYPDEKGTERIQNTAQPSTRSMNSYNRYPDEKGTESGRINETRDLREVTTVTPMKRGLKVWSELLFAFESWLVTTVTPMKRGLKARELQDEHVTTVTPMKRGLKVQSVAVQLQPLPR